MIDLILGKVYLSFQIFITLLTFVSAGLIFSHIIMIDIVRYVTGTEIIISGLIILFNAFTNRLLNQAFKRLSSENKRFEINNTALTTQNNQIKFNNADLEDCITDARLNNKFLICEIEDFKKINLKLAIQIDDFIKEDINLKKVNNNLNKEIESIQILLTSADNALIKFKNNNVKLQQEIDQLFNHNHELQETLHKLEEKTQK